MSDHADHADPTTSLDHRLEALDTAIGDLRRALERLRRRLDGEVRTRRLVLVEDDGFERVVAAADGSSGALTVRARAPRARAGTVGVEVFAADGREDDRAHLGMALLDDGDVVAALDVQAGRRATVWIAGDDPGPEPGPGAAAPA